MSVGDRRRSPLHSLRLRLVRAARHAACVAALCGGFVEASTAADVRVLCPSALRVPVLEAARGYARTSGHRIEFVFASVGAIHKRVATGDVADVAIGTAQGVDALVRLGRAVESTQTPLVRSLLALAVRKGDLAPNIASAEALADVLRRAASIVQPDPALGVPGGGQVTELLERLGMGAELKAKTRFVGDAREVVKRVGAGGAEIGIAAMGDIVAATEVTMVGPIIEPATIGVTYAGVVVRGAKAVEAGRGFLSHLAGQDAAKLFRAAGYGRLD